MVPIEQKCPQCGDWFMGSDIVGLPCMSCMGISNQSLSEILAEMNQMFYQEEENNDRPATN